MPDQYQYFIEWMSKTYGSGALLVAKVTRDNYTLSPYYAIWQKSLREELKDKTSKKPPLLLGQEVQLPEVKDVAKDAIVEEETPERELVWFVPGQVQYESKTGKFYDDTGLTEITRGDALTIRNRYDASFVETGGQWRPGELELQREQLGLSSAQFEWQKKQAEQDIAKSYEEWRRRLLSELTEPGDWITRWMVEQTPEKYPWKPPPDISGYDTSILQVQTALKQLESEVKSSPKELPELLPDLQRIVQIENELQDWVTAKATAEQQGAGWAARPTPEQILAGVKGTPPTPGWLTQFVPGLTSGQPIRKVALATPSGQALTRLAPSKAAALSGFADWAGGRPWRDILAHAELMQPRTPAGAGRARWRPVSQGVS